MARSIQKYLYDIQQSILSIEEYLGEKRDFFAYEQNKLLRRAVERELEIIGEAAKPPVSHTRQVPRELSTVVPLGNRSRLAAHIIYGPSILHPSSLTQ